MKIVFLLIMFVPFQLSAQESVVQKADEITRLQRWGTDLKEEKRIEEIFLSTHGQDLSFLKLLIDLGGDDQDLVKLLDEDIDDEAILENILSHLEAEEVSLGEVKVLSDIDDTFYSNLNDSRYPKKTVYPGVKAFYAALDQYVYENEEKDALEGDLVFLTARPDLGFGWVENKTHQMLKKFGILKAAILSGTLSGLTSNEAMARAKLDNFDKFYKLYPEYDFVWIGDSGQGDVIVGNELLETYEDRIAGVFIHDLGNIEGLSVEEKELFNQDGIILFQTYAGAALEAAKKELISKEGLRSVLESVEEVINAEPDSELFIPFSSDAQREATLAQLRADVERGWEYLG